MLRLYYNVRFGFCNVDLWGRGTEVGSLPSPTANPDPKRSRSRSYADFTSFLFFLRDLLNRFSEAEPEEELCFGRRLFWVLIVVMPCAKASRRVETAVWNSAMIASVRCTW